MLSADEIGAACTILKAKKKLGPKLRFALVQLDEPPKPAVLAWKPGQDCQRIAFITAFDTGTGRTYEARVDLKKRAVVWFNERKVTEYPYGQPPIIIEEFFKVNKIVKADKAWRAAVKRRGLTDADIENVQVDPFSAGYFGEEYEKGRRLVSSSCYWRDNIKTNGYAHPIEGVIAKVDLINNCIVQLIDDKVVIPVPKVKHDYHRNALPKPRTDIKPLDVVQREGASFTVEGQSVAWQNWRFRIGFTPREGLVLHQLAWKDWRRERPVIYRASVTEMVVPYADPTPSQYWKNAFDAGEYGLGKLANALELGCDCLGHIRYFDVPAADDEGNAFVMKNAICMHEEDHGILWKHSDFRHDMYEVRRSRRLVISFFATVGNYDYGFNWQLYQDGTIQLEVKLTGIVQTAAVAPGKKYSWGGMLAPGLGGPTHQHFFNARLHMMVDGGGNSVREQEFAPRPWGNDNPYGNVFDAVSRPLLRERDAARLADGAKGRSWKIINPNRKNAVGEAPGYVLVVQAQPVMLAQEGSHVRRRGTFATKHLFVTPYEPSEKYASGDYPNQHAGDGGLGAYIEQNRPIDNADLVVWHTFGVTHLCRPEDFPVMPVEQIGFTLKPSGFFDANPALDLPADKNARSVDAGKDNCCS